MRLTTPAGDADGTQLKGRQARLTFAYFVLQRAEGVSRDELAEVLWPTGPPSTWRPALRGVVSRVRRFLEQGGLTGDGVLAARDGGYQLSLPDSSEVDVEAATTRELVTAKRALDEGDLDTARAAAVEVVSVTGRRLLAGEDGDWIDRWRDQLCRARLQALHVLSDVHSRSGQSDRAVRAAEEARAIEPLQESGYRLLMRAHAANGERGEALRVYQRCRQMLADELGVDPSAQTTAVYMELLRDDA